MNNVTDRSPLRYIEKELQLISLDSLVMFDPNGIIVDVNEATVEATGRSREELIRTPFADYFTDSTRAQKGVNLVFETGEVRDYELIMKTKDGTEIIVSYNASVYKDQSGKIIGAFAAARDITQRKRADVEIHNLQRYNRGLIETSLDPLVTFDQNGIIMDVNEATIKATGRSREELIGTPFVDYFTDPEKAHKGVNLVFGLGEVRNYELVMKARDGTETIVAYNASVYKDETEQIVGAFAAARDITERKNAEIALNESKAELELIFRIAADAMCVIDADFNIIKVNKTFIRLVGMNEDKIIGKKCYDIFSGEFCHTKDCPLEMIQKGEEFVERESVKKLPNGKEIPIILSAARFEKNGKFVGIVEDFKDITGLKNAKKEIQDLQRYYRGLIEINLDPLVTFDKKGIILDVNEATIKATGRSREELIGTPFADYFTDPEKAQKGVNLVFGIGEFWNYELVMKAKDGTEIIVAYNASVYKDETGQIVGAFAAARDITERKNAEIALSESKTELDLIFQIAANAMCVIDADFNIINVNKTFIRLVGMDEDEIIGRKCYNVFSGECCHTKECPLEMIKKGEEFVERESIKIRPDGKEIPIILSAARFEKNGKFVGIVEDFKDITGLKRAKKEIQDLQRYNRGLIEVNLDPLVTFDKKGIILDVNEATIKATGRTREELIGTLFADYFTDPKNANKAVELVFENKEIRDYELIIKARDGTETTVAYNASVYKDEAGEIVGVFAAARDITERKRSKQELRDTIKRLEAYTGRVNSLMVTILEEISDVKTKAIILDITGIEQDIETLNPLINIARYSKLLDATCIITGIKPETVQRLSGLGVVLDPVTAERSLEEGLRYTILITEENNDNR
jgi:PAS domain S-box-containing protein